jgi:hypothetical protein
LKIGECGIRNHTRGIDSKGNTACGCASTRTRRRSSVEKRAQWGYLSF